MGDRSKIEWTDASWNPIGGCSRASPGCANCYAERLAPKLQGAGAEGYDGVVEPGPRGPRWTGKIDHAPSRLDLPLRWRRPRDIFVASMSDPFHPGVGDAFLASIFYIMVQAIDRRGHRFQLLTKRSGRLRDWMTGGWGGRPDPDWPGWSRLIVGVSVEDQRRADERLPNLAAVPFALRMVSFEPLIRRVDVAAFVDDAGKLPWEWAIVGGESGHGARPVARAWVRELRDAHSAAGVPFLFKQWGAWAPASEVAGDTDEIETADIDGERVFRYASKKATGRTLDGRTWDERPMREDWLRTGQ